MSIKRKAFVAAVMTASAMTAGTAVADIIHADDVIINGGSLCVGMDCVNGESFGFDTLRLKENNLRIHFNDTSASASFPSNDWRITANDSSNGGANKFSIDDVDGGRTPFTIEAGAQANTLYVEADGDVGVKTSNPVVDIHVVEGNTPTLRLEQDGSDGFTAQSWDLAGNETNFFVRDVTNGSKLPFRIKPGAPTDSIYVQANGRISLGTTASPTHTTIETALMIEGDTGVHNGIVLNSPTPDTVSSFTFTKSSVPQWFISSRNDLDQDKLIFYGNTVQPKFAILQDGKLGLGGTTAVDAANSLQHSNGARLTTGGVWTDASSRSLKDNIMNISTSAAYEAFKELNPVTFSYKAQPDETYAGFIAEDVPSIVATNDRKGLAPMDIVAILTKVVQKQDETIENLSKRINQLEKQKEVK